MLKLVKLVTVKKGILPQFYRPRKICILPILRHLPILCILPASYTFYDAWQFSQHKSGKRLAETVLNMFCFVH